MSASLEIFIHPKLASSVKPADPSLGHEQSDASATPNRTVRPWTIVLIAAGLLLGAVAYVVWNHARAHVTTDNAAVAGMIHPASSRIAGSVAEVLIDDHSRVVAGDPMIRLDPRDANLSVAQARNQVAEMAARSEQALAGVQQARAQRSQAEAKAAKTAAELQRARLDQERAVLLAEGGARFAAISRQEFDAAQAAFDVASASSRASESDLQSANALLTSSQAAAEVALSQSQSAELRLEEAELQRSYLVIAAPVTGTVGRKNVEVGQRVQPGQFLAGVVGDEKWVIANFKETQLAHLRIGQRALIRIDAIPGHRFAGTVKSFSPAAGSQFALLPPDNATGNFTKIVQRVPVKIVFDSKCLDGFEERIVPGLSAEVDVEVSP